MIEAISSFLPFGASAPYGLLEAALVLAVVAAGSAVQAAAGFGVALIAAPVLLLVYGPLIPGPLIAASTLLTVLMAYRDRHAIDFHGLAWALSGRVIGTAAAAVFLSLASQDAFDVAFAVMVLAGVLVSLVGVRIEPRPASSAAAGALSGLMGTISSIGGPPMALLYQHAGGPRLRATVSGFFVIGSTMSLSVLAAVGRFGAEEIGLALFLCPAVVVGYALAGPLRDRIDSTGVRPLILGLCSASAAFVLWRVLA